MIEISRRKMMSSLNSKYIYGKIPLVHAIVFIIEMAITSRLIAKYNSYYADKPVLTIMITNAVLGGIADTLAQTLTAFRMKQLRDPNGKDNFVSIEIQEMDKRGLFPASELMPLSKNLPPPFGFERLTRFMAYGFMMSPVQYKWYSFLNKAFPITKQSGIAPALKMVAFDQLMFAPIGLACFFTFMTVAEGGGRRAVARKFQDVYLPALKANFMLWPAVQILNFRAIPLQFRIPFVSTVGIAWTVYLSLTNSADEA